MSGDTLACKTHIVKFFSLRNITHRKKKMEFNLLVGKKKNLRKRRKKIVCSKDLAPSKKMFVRFEYDPKGFFLEYIAG